MISDDAARVDVAVVHRFLNEHSYWAPGITYEVTERAVAGSLSFGLYAPDGSLAGFARAVTDRATYAYLADVFVLDAHRGRRLGTWLVQTAIEHPQLQTIRRWTLFTADAHGLYERFGFGPAVTPERYMELLRSGGPAGGRS